MMYMPRRWSSPFATSLVFTPSDGHLSTGGSQLLMLFVPDMALPSPAEQSGAFRLSHWLPPAPPPSPQPCIQSHLVRARHAVLTADEWSLAGCTSTCFHTCLCQACSRFSKWHAGRQITTTTTLLTSPAAVGRSSQSLLVHFSTSCATYCGASAAAAGQLHRHKDVKHQFEQVEHILFRLPSQLKERHLIVRF